MEKPNVIVIHGAYGYPNENWFGWLKNELFKSGIDSFVPHFPTPENQHLQQWLTLFNQFYKHLVHAKTILIGHSLGAAFIFRWLEQWHNHLSTLIVVGPFIGKVGVEKFDAINESFFIDPFDWQHITNVCAQIYCYYGTNDLYVARKDFNLIASNLGATKILVSNAGHFNSASGYNVFPHLLVQLKQLIKESQYD